MDNYSRTKIYYKVRQTSLEMLEDRGFVISDDNRYLSYQDFANRLEENKINIEANHSIIENRTAYISFILDTKSFSKKDLNNLKLEIDEKYPMREMVVIIIVQEKPTPQIAKELQNDEFKSYEIFLTKNLMFNITRHEIVPRHILLTEDESKRVLDEFQATKQQLPKLPSTDPVAKYYGMKAGEICKIIRHSPMTGESIYYRMIK
jgi:DNA-directed RNA polymerase I, II, and III subunit RPABC1